MNKNQENTSVNLFKNKFLRSSKIFTIPIHLVYLTLPYRDIQDLAWNKNVKGYTLSITTGINRNTKQPYGIPYGAFARKLMYYTCTEAAKKKTRFIELGNSYKDAFEKLSIRAGKKAGGKSFQIFKEQILRLFHSRIELGFEHNVQSLNAKAGFTEFLNLADKIAFFSNNDKFDFKISLSQDFYNYIIYSHEQAQLIPFNNATMNSFSNNPMLMDLYIFLNYKAYCANYSKNNLFVSYQELFEAFGTTASLRKFKENLKKNLKKLYTYHKELIVADNQEGIMISKEAKSDVMDKSEQLDLFGI